MVGNELKKKQPFLTIVIPTYNRNDSVVENVRKILPQIHTQEVELVVLDNCSKIPVYNSLLEQLGEKVFEELSIIRNVGNLGLVGNSLRIFEVGTAPFIWTLCDDDLVEPNGVQTVLSAIRRHAESVFLWFPVKGGPSHRGPGLHHGMLEAIKLEPNLFFIALSSCVFNRNFFLNRLRFGYLYAYSWAPFICPLLSDIDNAANLIFISDQTVAAASQIEVKNKWSKLDVCLGIRTLLELPMSNDARKLLRFSINSFSFSTSRLFFDSLSENTESRWKLFRIFIQRRYTPFHVSAGFWLLLALLSENAPFLMRMAVYIVEKMVGRSLLVEVEDRFSRS
jgi:glycosyltransferase involved in cell wall biosynthesis